MPNCNRAFAEPGAPVSDPALWIYSVNGPVRRPALRPAFMIPTQPFQAGGLPLLHRMEERAGVRRPVVRRSYPSPGLLPTRASRGEGEIGGSVKMRPPGLRARTGN
jgi:hypothetical protein